MLPRWPNQLRSIHALVMVVSSGACTASHSGAPDVTKPEDSTASDPDGGTTRAENIELDVADRAMEPGETTTIAVRVSPPGVYDVQLALIDAKSNAYLESPILTTTAQGVAETQLSVVARSESSFTVLAQTDGVSANLDVTILEPSVADLTVVPMYAGSRTFTTWHVLWGADLNCNIGYDDAAWGRAVAVDRLYDEDNFPEYQQQDVSAREPLTVLVKAERFASGCVAGVSLTPKIDNRLEIPITQRLADVSQLAFGVQMNIAADSEFWSAFQSSNGGTPYLNTLTAQFRDESTSDIDALLDTMADLQSNPNEQRFSQTRIDAAWDALLAARLSPEGAQNGLSSRVLRWLQQGATLLQTPNAFVADLRVHDSGKRGEFALATVAGQDYQSCGMNESHLASVTIDAQDMLRVGFHLRFLPSPLFTCLANAAVAAASDAGVSNVLSALAVDFDCNIVANWMSNSEGLLFDECDTQCGADLCHAALDEMWNRVVVSDLYELSFEVNAAGKAVLSPDAVVTGVDANWVGTTAFLGSKTSVSGTLRSCEPGSGC